LLEDSICPSSHFFYERSKRRLTRVFALSTTSTFSSDIARSVSGAEGAAFHAERRSRFARKGAV
jgi:hypothetical protein